mmetsp:Transcript_17269/g.24945  ORF Transcript_17269/g.24945 Transcript_17269/m.24945 type:complete len:285 (-) Transcript_17269:211-1065(-)
MEFVKKTLGLVGKLDESGEGYEPSPFSKMLAVDKKTNYKPIDFGKKYGGDKKVLVVCTEERYMTMENGKKFSTGNHPVETIQPMMHLLNAGFEFDVATPTGKAACLEMWAMPSKDNLFKEFFNTHKAKFDSPFSLVDIVSGSSKENYVAIFVPGGHGAMVGLPMDANVGKLINFVKDTDRYLMSICHGPAALLAAKEDPHPYKGYKIACFPTSVDKQAQSIGYVPGSHSWYFADKLTEKGFNIVNTAADDTVSVDRKLLTGASPKACQKLGEVAAKKLLEEYGN